MAATSLYKDEFPLLEAHGIYAADIRGDGNCLFNALSDQMYGHQDRHDEIRATTIDYMRRHPDTFKAFLEVHPGGGQRRNPRRKTASAYSSANTVAAQATPEEIDRVFEEHLRRMARGGVWGDNMEIVAFSQAYQMSVKIWQREYAYIIDASDHIQDEDPSRTCHIAYHSWEHYSSIRNIQGPHSGPPSVNVRELSPEGAQQQQARLQAAPTVLPWMISSVASCVAHFDVSESDIIRAIEESKNNIDQAVNKLYEIHAPPQSVASSQQSSSVERSGGGEYDSDGDASIASGSGTNKKYHASRLDRNTKSARRVREHQMRSRQHLAEKLSDPNNSLESLINATGGELKPAVLTPRRNSLVVVDGSDTDQRSDSLPDPLKDGDTSSGSEYSQPTTVTSSMITIKLPKLQQESSPQPLLPPSSPSRATPPPAASAAANPTGVTKRQFTPARVKKEEKKRAQKQRAKDRQVLAATGGKLRALPAAPDSGSTTIPSSSPLAAHDMARTTSHPGMTTAIKTLYI